jgi:hypothetical protein
MMIYRSTRRKGICVRFQLLKTRIVAVRTSDVFVFSHQQKPELSSSTLNTCKLHLSASLGNYWSSLDMAAAIKNEIRELKKRIDASLAGDAPILETLGDCLTAVEKLQMTAELIKSTKV